jgi:hypothetical protein
MVRVVTVLVVAVAGVLLASVVAGASGTITFSNGPGTGAAPSTLGPYTMQAFAPTGTSVSGPTGAITLPPADFQDESYASGTTGYLDITPLENPVTITLPAGTGAFYLYAGWNCPACSSYPSGVSITAAAQDGTSSGPVPIASAGGTAAEYFGFYAACGSTLSTVTLTIKGSFAPFITVGAFGIAPASANTSCSSTPPTGASTAKTYPCSTGLIGGTCSVGTIQLAGSMFHPVAAYVPKGTAEYEQLLKLGAIPVSGECLQPCVLTIEALLKEGKLAGASTARASAAAARLLSLGKVQLKITKGAVTASLRITAAGKKHLRKLNAKHFAIELRLSAKTPSGKRLGGTKVVVLSVARGKG